VPHRKVLSTLEAVRAELQLGSMRLGEIGDAEVVLLALPPDCSDHHRGVVVGLHSACSVLPHSHRE
jgi:hypothetical protein